MRKGIAAHGAFVAVCGPVGLSRDAVSAVRACDVDSKRAIGGIQFHEECVFPIPREQRILD